MTTKIGLIKSTARNLHDFLIDATPASLTGSTLDFLELIQSQSGQLLGANAYLYEGAGAGQERVVGSFDTVNRRVAFPQVFTSTPSTNTKVLLTRTIAKSDYENAIDTFWNKARYIFLEDMVATMQFVGSQYEYLVPSGMSFISTIRLIPSTNSDYASDDDVENIFEIPPRYFRVERNVGGSYHIVIDSRKLNIDDVIDKQYAKIIGQARPHVGATDNAEVPAEIERYIITGASMQLAAQNFSKGKEWERMFYMYRDEIEGDGRRAGLEEYIYRHPRGKQVGV